jgi:uncharacterized protein YciI
LAGLFGLRAVAQDRATSTQTLERGQDEGAAKPASQAPKPPAGLELESITLVLLRKGDNPPKMEPAAAAKMQAEHLGHLGAMAATGKMVVAGPLGDQPDPTWRGICLYKASLEEARKMAEADPAVKAGAMKVEVMSWYTMKGAMEFPLAGKMAELLAPKP